MVVLLFTLKVFKKMGQRSKPQ